MFPVPVLAVFTNATAGHQVAWNAASQQLLAVQISETFARFPNLTGFVVRTGET